MMIRFGILSSFRNFLGPICKDGALWAFGSEFNQKTVCDPQNKFSTSVRDGLVAHFALPNFSKLNSGISPVLRHYSHHPIGGGGKSVNVSCMRLDFWISITVKTEQLIVQLAIFCLQKEGPSIFGVSKFGFSYPASSRRSAIFRA